jgi:hypothetical protein
MTHAKLPAAARELVSVCVEARDMGQASADLAGQSVRHRTAQARERLAWHREVSGPLHLSVVDPNQSLMSDWLIRVSGDAFHLYPCIGP